MSDAGDSDDNNSDASSTKCDSEANSENNSNNSENNSEDNSLSDSDKTVMARISSYVKKSVSSVTKGVSSCGSKIKSSWTSLGNLLGTAASAHNFAIANPVRTAVTASLLSYPLKNTCYAFYAPPTRVTLGPGASFFSLHVTPLQTNWNAFDPVKNNGTIGGSAGR